MALGNPRTANRPFSTAENAYGTWKVGLNQAGARLRSKSSDCTLV